jgi:hypothetical protein
MRESGTRVFSPAGMTASLTPVLALAYLGELSVDVRAAIVLDAAGAPLAGDAALAPAVREMRASSEARRPAAGGTLLAARTADGGTIAALAGPLSVLAVLGRDLAAAAEALDDSRSEPPRFRDSPS